MMREVAVIGTGLIPYGELWSKSLRTLWAEAALNALDDAGLDDVRSDRLQIEQLEFDTAHRALLFRAGGNDWRCDLQTYELRRIDDRKPVAEDGLAALPEDRIGALAAGWHVAGVPAEQAGVEPLGRLGVAGGQVDPAERARRMGGDFRHGSVSGG